MQHIPCRLTFQHVDCGVPQRVDIGRLSMCPMFLCGKWTGLLAGVPTQAVLTMRTRASAAPTFSVLSLVCGDAGWGFVAADLIDLDAVVFDTGIQIIDKEFRKILGRRV